MKEPKDYTEKRVKGLFGYGVSSPKSRLTLNNFGFEFLHGEMCGVKNNKELVSPYALVPERQNTTRSDLIECPMCMKIISKGVISEHLNVCGDLHRFFEEDRDDKDCVDRRRGEADISACPLCDKALFNDFVNKHLETCDRLQGIFDDNNFARADVTCPFCNVEVHGDLSSHISRCLSKDIPNISYENDFESVTKEEDVSDTCLVCKKALSNVSLNVHLENCESLQGVFDDDIVILEDSIDCKDCVDTNSVQRCSFGNSKVVEMTDRFTICLRSQGESDEISTSTDVQNVTSVNDSDLNKNESAPNTCPICGLKGSNDLKDHLERECLRTLDFSEEFNFSFSPSSKESVRNSAITQEVFGKNGVSDNVSDFGFPACNERRENNTQSLSLTEVKRGTNNHVNSNVIKSDNSHSGVNDPCANAAGNRQNTNQTILKDDPEPLIFCRSCARFYSLAFCPVCCGNT